MQEWKILSTETELSKVVSTILKNRGITSAEEQKLFLNPPALSYWVEKLPNEFKESLKSSRDIIQEFINANKPILIHGDYDVDGVCATAILFSSIREDLGYDNAFAFVPNRFNHGYGLSMNSIDATIRMVEDTQEVEEILFITVDSGITSVDEVAHLKNLGHRVIITDHHQKAEKVPDADCILWNDQIVGASIAWLLSKSLSVKNDLFLSYACLATVADLQPITGFNRSIVTYGLKQINANLPQAFSELIQIAGKKDKEITTYDLGWLIGPRLNASGRVDDAIQSLELLVEKDPDAVKELAWNLSQTNSQRQDKTFEMYELAAKIEEDKLPAIIITYHDDYHEGIIGLVASRIMQKYWRPTIVISTSEDIAKGSVRSIPGINIIEVLRTFDDLFESLGGHPMAAGFSIKKGNIKKLEKSLKDYSTTNIKEEDLERVLPVDIEIPAELISLELIKKLEQLEPYGVGNERPIFATRSLGLSSLNKVGREGNHLSVRFLDGDNFYKGIFFGKGELYDNLSVGDFVDVAYTLKKNEYNGKTYVDLIIKDIKKT